MQWDVVVIGGGSAGFAAARTAAAEGGKVAVIEGAREIGGLCILRGCMPTKALLESAHRWRAIGEAREFGLHVKALRPDLPAILARKNRLIADFAGYRKKQLEHGKFRFIRGRAQFIDPHQIEVVQGKKRTLLKAKTFILATGSEIDFVPIPGLAEAGFLTSDSALVHATLPLSLIVLGGGAIAVEFADFYASLGSKVTIVQRSGHLVKEYDEEVSVELETAFRRRGIAIHTGTQLQRVERKGKLKKVIFTEGGKTRSVAASEILYALGRTPRVRDLNLFAAGIILHKGHLKTDLAQRTPVPHIFAAGDAAGPYEVVHIAIQQGEIAARNAMASIRKRTYQPERIDYLLRAEVTFTDPEIARVGLTEREARAKGIDCLTAQYRFDDHGKSMIMGARDGFVKLIADRKGVILGAQIIGPHASDLIHELIAVMYYKGTVFELATMPHYHPTLAEIVTYPAEEIADQIKAKR